MRKVDNSTSQDGADSTSISSTYESEGKKSSIGLKTKRNSIKRKIPNFSHDSDDTVIEPLLQSEKGKSSKSKNIKFSISRTDLTNETPNIVTESHLDYITKTSSSCLSQNIPNINTAKDISVVNTSATAPIYNHMNTNIFGGLDTTKSIQTKSAVIVEIDNTKCSSYNPSPLIFTTAKIHADNKAKQLEPLQITPVPILSTIEGNVIKSKPGTFGGAEKDYGYINSKSDTQRTKNQENEENLIKTSNFYDKASTKSMTITTDSITRLTNICKENASTITTISQTHSSSKGSIDKSLKMTDISFPDKTNLKVDLKLSTEIKDNKTMQQYDKPYDSAVDSTMIKATEKVVGTPAQFGLQNTIGKLRKDDKDPPIDDNKNKTSEGISFHEPNLPSNKVPIKTTKAFTDSTNKEKPSILATNIPPNRQLQRQKNATVEDITDVDAKTKTIDCGKSEGSNLLQNQNTTTNMSTKDSTYTKSGKTVKSVNDKPKVSAEIDNATTKLIKPIKTPSSAQTDKTSLVTEVPTKTPKPIVTSAKSYVPETKGIISNKDSKPNTFTTGMGSTKPKNTSVKETGLDTKTISEQSAIVVGSSQLTDNVGSFQNMKTSSSINLGVSSTSKPKLSNKMNLPLIATKTVNQNVINKTPTTTASSTIILKDAITSSLPSTSSKTMIATNKEMQPVFSKHNKDSRA